MLKQITSNTFQKGLAKDYSPLSSEQNTLTDCLNGTFITNDGDELVLQNDMGNARVQGIKLDSGYVPVGMCEYGGVTYIASYNPITRKGQVGSFPSPQETFFSQSWGGEKKEETYRIGNNDGTIVLEYIKQIFSSSDIIRPGDKFDIFITDSKYYNKKLVSNTDNVTPIYELDENGKQKLDDANQPIVRYKVSSPKNKAVTLSVCISDSSGNLHDITHTLKRFRLDIDQDTEEVKGCEELPWGDDPVLYQNMGTIFQVPIEVDNENSSSVDKHQAEPKNIYNHKISGNLYLVYRINSLDSVEVTTEFFKGPLADVTKYLKLNEDSDIEGNTEVDDGYLAVSFDITYRYNCPDGYYDKKDEITEDISGRYYSLYGLSKDFAPDNVIHGVKVSIDNSNNSEENAIESKTIYYLEFDPKSSKISKPEYNYNTNLYTSRQRYLINDIYIKDVDRLKIESIPALKYGYLPFFKQSTNIDIGLINSGEISISQWRYFVDDKGVRISLGLESYPFLGTRLTNVSLSFYKLTGSQQDINNPYIIKLGEKTSYHGNNDVYVSFDEIDKRSIYCVLVSYQITNIVNNLVSDGIFYVGARTLITTRLYNKLYQNQLIVDFNNLSDEILSDVNTYNYDIAIQEYEIYDNSTISTSGNPLYPQYITDEENPTVEMGYITKQKSVDIQKKITASLNQNKRDLYPFEVDDIAFEFDGLSVIDSNESNQNPTIIGNHIYDDKILSEINKGKLVPRMVKNDIVHIEGELYSELIGNKTVNDITFSNAITQYFPPFRTGESELQKNQHYNLFGYTGVGQEYYIAYGVTYRGLTNHKDHHGAKYIEVNLAKGNQTEDKTTMIDLHGIIYGKTWDYPEVMEAVDGTAKFNLTDFVSNYEFLKYVKNKSFVLFKSNGTSANNKYNDSNVEGWVSLSRTEEGPEDKKVMAISNKPLLFWKHNDTFYLVVNRSNESYEVNDFMSLMDNIYVRSAEEFKKDRINIIDNDSSAYNSSYTSTINFKVKIKPNYTFHTLGGDPIDTASVRLGTVLHSKTLGPLYGQLVKYIQFNKNDEARDLVLQASVNMEGLEEVKSVLGQLANGVYNGAVLVDPNNVLHMKDINGKSLLVSKGYEVISSTTQNGNTSYEVSEFGSSVPKNRALSQTIEVNNGQVVPTNTITISKELINAGTKHQNTILQLNGQQSIQLRQ